MKKKVLLMIACVAAMLAAGSGLKAQEVTVPLLPGWTWISYPGAVPFDIATAFGSFTPLEGDVIESQFGMVSYVDGAWLGDFDQFYPGYGYMYYSTRMVPVTVTFNAQQPTQQVVVTTDTPQFITAISAIGGGEVTTNDGTYILVKGLCWATHENPTTNDDFYQEAESGVGTFSVSMTGLNISTTYYVRAYAVTPNGTVYGDQKTFTTRDGIPAVSTASVTSITGETASCGGTVTDNGGLNVTARGVCWSISQNPTVSDSHTTNGSGLGSFTSSITGLSISTTYYVKAYASTSQGTAYGEEVSFTTRNGIPTLTTTEVTNIQGIVATSGGNITDDGGLAITARGVCWSTTPSPTLANFHTTNGNGAGSFYSYMTGLSMSTTYYVRAYATNSFVTVYGNQLSFTTTNDERAYVDLGLPSGLLWATCNVGADSPEDYGDYFAWGETLPKDTYNWSTYQYCNGNSRALTKYCNKSNYGYNGFTDNLTTLQPEDDAATANWGSDWRMPTKDEWQELYQNTTITWTTQNGVNGRLFTASNGNNLFLPAAACHVGSGFEDVGSYGRYWSSSLLSYDPSNAWFLYFDSNEADMWSLGGRDCGQPVRAVHSSVQNTSFNINATSSPSEGGTVTGDGTYQDGQSCMVTATANVGYTFTNWTENGEVVSTDATYSFVVETDRFLVANFTGDHAYVDLGLPSGLLWATYNVGADSPEDYGAYFAWGETQPNYGYDWSTYQYCNGSYNTLTRYCNNSSYGYNGFTDDLTTLLPGDDAATVNWGAGWRMPTKADWQELLDNTTNGGLGTQNGVDGYWFIASNGNRLFLPAAGCHDGENSGDYSRGFYWSSSLGTDSPDEARTFYFMPGLWGGSYGVGSRDRCNGLSVRAVRQGQNTSYINATSNPSEGGIITGGGTYQMGQSCTVTATANAGYTFTNWTENGEVVSTDAIYSFTVEFDRTLVANFTGDGVHAYVDLGLPSGLLWATCNVGADSPENYGHYFAWGETQPKRFYNWDYYQYCNGNYNTLTRYCNNSSYGYNGFIDDLTTLLSEDDAATASWGDGWRMPTKEEWQELYQNTTHTITYLNEVKVLCFTASNGSSLILPAAGYDEGYNHPIDFGSNGYYWSSSLSTDTPSGAWYFYFEDDYFVGVSYSAYRSDGRSVRAVRSTGQNTSFIINVTSSPSEGGIVTGGGTYQEGQSCTVTATANPGYTFTNWTENGEVVSVEAIYTFTVNGDRNLVANFAVSSSNHDYVDLGLPSGLLWATCNVGADSPEDYGDYFAWGETQPKDTYNWSTYQYCNGDYNTLTKYCSNSSYGYNGFTDNLTTLLPEDDAATANWGSDWRMPTKEEWQELYNNTTVTWTTQNGVNGRLFTASNGNSLFLPAAGCRWGVDLEYAGGDGNYWSSSLHSSNAWNFYFNSGGYSMHGSSRSNGRSVRAVRSSRQN